MHNLYCAQEDKKQLFSHMEQMDKQYTKTMNRLPGNMEKLEYSIADGLIFSTQDYIMLPPSEYPPTGAYNPGLYAPPYPSHVFHSHNPAMCGQTTSSNEDFDHDPNTQ